MTDAVTGTLIGTWRLRSHQVEDKAAGTRSEPFGAAPSGLLVFGGDGYMSVLITADPAGAPPATPLLAYAGPYRVQSDRLVTTVEVAWVAAWVGSEQVRGLRLDGERLELTTLPTTLPGGSAPLVATLVWTRAT